MTQLLITKRCAKGGRVLQPGDVENFVDDKLAQSYIEKGMAVRYVPTLSKYRREWWPKVGHEVKNGYCIHCGRKIGGKEMERVRVIKRFAWGQDIFSVGDTPLINSARADLLEKKGYITRKTPVIKPERHQAIAPDWTKASGGWKCPYCDRVLRTRAVSHLKTHEEYDGKS